MSKPQLMNTVDDGLITGNVETNRQWCRICNFPTRCINIHSIDLPEDVGKPTNRLIAYERHITKDERTETFGPVKYIGIGCGCYAKFHRQIAHITTRVTQAG